MRPYAVVTHQDSCTAREDFTVVKVVGGTTAIVTRPKNLFVFAVLQFQAIVEHVQRTFPQTLVAGGRGLAAKAALTLVHLFEAAVLHDDRENFAANAASAVRNDGLVFQVVVFATL